MTEDEAKTKWCPFSRQVAVISHDNGTGATANRDGGSHYGVGDVSCIGSACMAWRWRVGWEPATLEHIRAAGQEPGSPDGHCGLAGRP